MLIATALRQANNVLTNPATTRLDLAKAFRPDDYEYNRWSFAGNEKFGFLVENTNAQLAEVRGFERTPRHFHRLTLLLFVSRTVQYLLEIGALMHSTDECAHQLRKLSWNLQRGFTCQCIAFQDL